MNGNIWISASLTDKIAFVALMFSAIAIIISIISIFTQKSLNRTNLEAKYFDGIFNKFLLETIPQRVEKVKFGSNNKLDESYKELNDSILEMMKKARYFSFVAPKFYNKLEKETMKVDELLVSISGKTIISAKEQNKAIMKIEKAVRKIYTLIDKNYCK